LRTVIGVVGSTREVRLKFMHDLGARLANEGYKVALVFRDEHDDVKSSKVSLVASLLGATTFIVVGSRLSLDDVRGLIPSKWCLVLVEGHRAVPHLVVAASEVDVSEVGPESIAVVPLNYEVRRSTTSLTNKVIDIDEAVKVVKEVVVEDVMRLLALENCGKCGFKSCRELAEAIARGEESPVKCVQRREVVKLMVNEELVPLNQFASKVFVQVLRGLISILKGVPRDVRKVLIEAELY